MPRISFLFWTWFAVGALALTPAGAGGGKPSDALTKEVEACFRAVGDDPGLAVVNAKLAFRAATPAQRADTSVPNDGEAEALRTRAKAMKRCREMLLAELRKTDTLLAPSLEMLFYQTDQVLDYLRQQAISYGTANTLNDQASASHEARRRAYDGASARRRAELSNEWAELLQRGHSNPPPPEPGFVCAWEELNILCK